MAFFLVSLCCSEFSMGQTFDVENVYEGFKFSGVRICSCKQNQAGGLQVVKQGAWTQYTFLDEVYVL